MSLDPSVTNAIIIRARKVRDKVKSAAILANRDPSKVRLVAVSKTFSVNHIRIAAAAGLTEIGENKLQETLEKKQVLESENNLGLTWHLIGHLQSNKASKAVAAFTWIHSVDSLNLMKRLDRAAMDHGVRPNFFVQINLADEATKFGISEDDVFRFVDAATHCKGIRMRGLMIIPPWSQNPEVTRPYFRRLRQLRDQLVQKGAPSEMLNELSMGMSHDFEVAITEGATLVRVGTAIFGQRST